MTGNTFYIIIFIFALSISFTNNVRARPDSHISIGVMGEHGHKAGEMMRTKVDVVVAANRPLHRVPIVGT